jgi:hypothetical protein
MDGTASNYSALCSDFYVIQKLGLKLEAPEGRENALEFFDRVRKTFPRLANFQRTEGEVSLESNSGEREWQWTALRPMSVRSGHVNPASMADAYQFHRAVLEIAPYFLSISPLNIAMLEIVLGFDFETELDKDSVVFDALLAQSPLAGLIDPGFAQTGFERVSEAQPALAITLGERGDMQAVFEVRTRPAVPSPADRGDDPISVLLTVRKFGPLGSLDELKAAFGAVVGHAEMLAEQRVIPNLVMPIHDTLQSRG